MPDEKIERVYRVLFGDNGEPGFIGRTERRMEALEQWAFGDEARRRTGIEQRWKEHDKMLRDIQHSQEIRQAEMRGFKFALYILLGVLGIGGGALGVTIRNMMDMLNRLLGG